MYCLPSVSRNFLVQWTPSLRSIFLMMSSIAESLPFPDTLLLCSIFTRLLNTLSINSVCFSSVNMRKNCLEIDTRCKVPVYVIILHYIKCYSMKMWHFKFCITSCCIFIYLYNILKSYWKFLNQNIFKLTLITFFFFMVKHFF